MFGKKQPYNPNLPSRKLNKDFEFVFDRGWSPILKPVINNHKVYLQLIQWTGGEGEQPFDPSTNTYFLGQNGLVTSITEAVNIAESFITIDYMDNIMDISTLTVTLQKQIGTVNILFNLVYKDLKGQTHTNNSIIFTDDIILDEERLNTSQYKGATRRTIAETLYELKKWIIIDDYKITPYSHNQTLSHSAIMNAINDAKAKFQVPILELTTSLIYQIEAMQTLSPLNPYYMIVLEDMRTGGRHTPICTELQPAECCIDDSEGGYEERGNPLNLSGCLCDAGQDEVRAVCRVIITQLGNVGNRYEITLNDLPYTFYNVKTGDNIQDVVNGLISNLPNQCTTGRDCTVINVTNNSFDLQADWGLGSVPNSWSKSVVYTGNARLTFTQIIQGRDYLAKTYRGVKHHLIAYNGNEWYDLGSTISFGANNVYVENGLYKDIDNKIKLGGTLIENTKIEGEYEFLLSIGNANNSSNLSLTSKYASFGVGEGGSENYLAIEFLNETQKGIIIKDKLNHRGVEYNKDYSQNYTERTLIDRYYATNFLNFKNGLRRVETSSNPLYYDVKLGGIITENTYISGLNSEEFAIRISDENENISSFALSSQHIGMLHSEDSDISCGILYVNTFKTFIYKNEISNKGIDYESDYSSTYTDRTLIDRAYLHNSLNFNNGISKIQIDDEPLLYNISLGGNITQLNTTLIGNESNYFEISNFMGIFLSSLNNGLDIEDGVNRLYSGDNIFYMNDLGAIYTGIEGIKYAYDYSSSFVDRSLVDKYYVDNLITASNGLTRTLNDIKLGGTITQDCIINDNRVTKKGIEYGANYSANYTNRSLVDKEYVDNKIKEVYIDRDATCIPIGVTEGDLVIQSNSKYYIEKILGYDNSRTFFKSLIDFKVTHPSEQFSIIYLQINKVYLMEFNIPISIYIDKYYNGILTDRSRGYIYRYDKTLTRFTVQYEDTSKKFVKGYDENTLYRLYIESNYVEL